MISPTKRGQAFTLVEILMVLAIIGISTLVTMPYLVKSIRGNRLRVAGQTVVKAGYHARTMALLRTMEMNLVFDLATHGVRVEPRHAPPPPASEEPPPEAPAGEPGANEVRTAAPPSMALSRTLDAVSIVSVEVKNAKQEKDGLVTVIYRTNGRCTPYEVRLRDEFGGAMTITVDALSTAKARREGE